MCSINLHLHLFFFTRCRLNITELLSCSKCHSTYSDLRNKEEKQTTKVVLRSESFEDWGAVMLIIVKARPSSSPLPPYIWPKHTHTHTHTHTHKHTVQSTYKSLRFCPVLMTWLIKHTCGCTQQAKREAISARAICSCERQITSGRLMSGEPSGELTAKVWHALKLLCLHTSTWMSRFNEIF